MAITSRRTIQRTFVLWLTLAPLAGWTHVPSEHFRQAIEYVHDSGDSDFAGTRLVAVDFLARFYEARRFETAWTGAGNVGLAPAALAASDQHGLSARDFHIYPIRLLQEMQSEQPEDPRLTANCCFASKTDPEFALNFDPSNG